ncbi:TetR/AcrR family transcriptional regulator [Mycolicibacterium mengxianglii]|uniref:TetR/AcrR family transcriptional regulator n=1 Tax=Mycolicibacterium mengxianglii TaxID=2736649 RepID=UPI0018D1C20E|nr:TetR/AcrR family transcriptional regulator [Mycolicibacterium mengxianglii]
MTKTQKPPRVGTSRRAEYAQATRRAAIDAAREVFSEKGYFATTVNEVAARARVSPATIYAVNGGKQGLLRALVEDWSDAPVIATMRTTIAESSHPVELLRYLTAETGQMRRDYGDIMRVVIGAAPHDAAAAEGFRLATSRWREFERLVARRLAQLDALRDDVDVDYASDILWLYLGYAGLTTLVDDNGWPYPRAEEWLCTTVCEALLADRFRAS